MERIVVGADGSPGAANAMRWASNLAKVHGAELIVMTGFVPTDSELPPGRVEKLLSQQQSQLDEWSEAARSGDQQVRTVVERGDPRGAILSVADREDADLVVVGRIGESAGPGLLHIGSLAEWLAHNADRPIAIVGGAVNVTTRSAIVGVDGSECSRAALAWVADLGKRTDLRVVVASVETMPVEWTPEDNPDNWRRGLEQRIRDDYAVSLDAAGGEYTALALQGSNAADALLLAAKDERTDIVVVGMRGSGGFLGLRIGGVALKVLHRADRPVVLIPPS